MFVLSINIKEFETKSHEVKIFLEPKTECVRRKKSKLNISSSYFRPDFLNQRSDLNLSFSRKARKEVETQRHKGTKFFNKNEVT